jgi:hypothetical protein
VVRIAHRRRTAMAKEAALGMNDMLFTAVRTLLVDLPVVAVKRGLGIADKRAVAVTAWKGYDASIRLGTVSIERLYGNGLFGAVLGRSVHGLVRLQRLNNAVTGAFFTALWRAADLPTASEVNALREELRALAAGVRAQGQNIGAQPARSRVRGTVARPIAAA